MTKYIELTNPRAKNLTGLEFGNLHVLGPIGRSTIGKLVWRCKCKCGETTDVIGEHLCSGHTQSCGCLQRKKASDNLRIAVTDHGLSHTNIHGKWQSMIARCNRPSNPSYRHYGARGIRVCDEWLNNFMAFYGYVTQLPHYGNADRSLDRIDNELGYAPGNVRWATIKQQRRNQRRCRMIKVDGITLTIAGWAERTSLRARTIMYRLNHGWSERDAVTKPSQRMAYRIMAESKSE